jgi:hypothetical protein
MKIIKTYQAVIRHQLNYTIIGAEGFADLGNLKRLEAYIFPLLDELSIGKEIPVELQKISNGTWINLSYNLLDKTYPLFLIVHENILKAVTTSLSDFINDESDSVAVGYESFMD